MIQADILMNYEECVYIIYISISTVCVCSLPFCCSASFSCKVMLTYCLLSTAPRRYREVFHKFTDAGTSQQVAVPVPVPARSSASSSPRARAAVQMPDSSLTNQQPPSPADTAKSLQVEANSLKERFKGVVGKLSQGRVRVCVRVCV